MCGCGSGGGGGGGEEESRGGWELGVWCMVCDVVGLDTRAYDPGHGRSASNKTGVYRNLPPPTTSALMAAALCSCIWLQKHKHRVIARTRHADHAQTVASRQADQLLTCLHDARVHASNRVIAKNSATHDEKTFVLPSRLQHGEDK